MQTHTTLFNGYSVPSIETTGIEDYITEVVETPADFVPLVEDTENPPASYRQNDYEAVSETDVVNMDLTAENLTQTFSPAPQNYDPEQMIHEIGKFNPKFANQLWYKLQNKPGTIKTLDGEKYIVSPKGSWVKQRN